MVRWHRPPDTWFEIRALAVWGRARYLSVTEAPHNIESVRLSGKETFSLKLECQSGDWTRDFRLSKQATLTTAPGPPPLQCVKTWAKRSVGIAGWRPVLVLAGGVFCWHSRVNEFVSIGAGWIERGARSTEGKQEGKQVLHNWHLLIMHLFSLEPPPSSSMHKHLVSCLP